jgi:hypothetical protein
MAQSAEVTGMEDLMTAFRGLIRLGGERSIMDVLKRGAEVYATAVRTNIRVKDLIDTSAYINNVRVVRHSPWFWAIYTDTIYARVHELGAVIHARRAPYLKFQIDGQWVQVRSVKIPARPHWRPAIDKAKTPIIREIGNELNRRLRMVAQ